ncbi:MAG: extracellular solute-binding protein [Clostridium sp.]|nr:extracellular solute-binding protein [Clostridium sp.]
MNEKHGKRCVIIFLLIFIFILTGCKLNEKLQSGDRNVITLGVVYLDDNVRDEVAEFNKEDEEYKIEIKDYSDQEDPVSSINTDIISGNAPDLIALSQLPAQQYASKGVLEDLTSYFEKDDELSESDFLDSLINTMQIDGKLYYSVSSFELMTMITGKDIVADSKDWSFEKMGELVKQKDKNKRLFLFDSKWDRLFNLMYDGGGSADFVNLEQGTCNFDSLEFMDLLEICNAGDDNTAEPDDITEEELLEISNMIKNGNIMFVTGRITPDQILANRVMFGRDITFVGSYFRLNDAIGMYSKSKVKDGAWRFLKRLMSKEYQGKHLQDFQDMPVRKDCMEAYIKMKTATEEYTDEFGNDVKPLESVECLNGMEAKVKPLEEADVQLFQNLLSETTRMVGYEQNVFNIINEESMSYFYGDKSVEETAAVIQNRVANYISEKQ